MNKLITAGIAVIIIMAACKKESTQTVTKTVTVTDTIHKTDTVKVNQTITDTVNVLPNSIIGEWKLYKIENVNNGVSTFTPENMVFNFTLTQLQEAQSGGPWQYTYNVTYGSNYANVVYSSSNTTLYTMSTVGTEYRLTDIQSPTQSQIWYLKK